jgi:hypothetical protein
VRAASASRGFLLLERGGTVWGVANDAVEALTRKAGSYRLSVGGRPLSADEVLGVVEDLNVLPVSAAARRFWPVAVAGLAVHGERPLVVMDPRQPPRALWLEQGEGIDGERE